MNSILYTHENSSFTTRFLENACFYFSFLKGATSSLLHKLMMVDKFEQIKEQTLSNLYDYGLDFSPKGSVDLPIQDLVSIINKHSEYFTTSCCSGRISIAQPANESNKGVHWLFVKHGYISEQDVLTSLLTEGEILSNELVTMKCEAFIMHICCKTLDSARKLHQIALESGFRESGITLGSRKTMLAIRSTSFSMETPIARGSNLLFDKNYLQILISEANSRMNQNFDRIQRFSQRLKDVWLWPSFNILGEKELSKAVQSKLGIDAGHWKRWGHCSLKLSNSDSFLVNGGQGIENKTKSALNDGTTMKSSRNPSSITLHPEGKQESYEINALSSCMHGQLVDTSFDFGGKRLLFVIQSGGRLSPLQPLKCLNIYQTTDDYGENRYQSFLRVKETGEIPENRWGHSFHRLSSAFPENYSQSFCLFGGRNEKMIFNDIYMLEVVGSGAKLDDPLAEFSLECHWKKISLSCPSSTSELVAIALGRFFHASCLISIPLETRNIMIKNGSDSNTNDSLALSSFPVLFFHGGISSLSNPKPRNDGYFIDFENVTLSPVSFMRKSEEGSLASSPSSSMRISRFGHSLTLLDGNCLFLFGGNGENEKENSSYLFDYFLSFRFASTLHDITPTQKHLELVYRSFNSSSITNGAPLSTFPCEKCRSHHQIIYQEGKKGSGTGKGESSSSRQDKLLVVGGGAMTLAFGNHYCEPLLIHLIIGNDPVNQQNQNNAQFLDGSSLSKNERIKSSLLLNEEKKNEVKPNEEVGNFDHFLCVPKLFVKSLKTILEKSSFYNKEMKIQSLRSSCQNVKVNYEIVDIFNDSKPLLGEGDSNNFESILNEYCQKESTEESKQSPLDWMIVPISSSGYGAMLRRKGKAMWDEIKSLQLPVSFLPILKTSEKLPKPSGVENHHLTIMKGEKGANLFLTQLIDQSLLQGTIPSSQTMKLKQLLLQEIPQKYEVVGDILLIPEQSLVHEKWTEILTANHSQNWKELLTTYFPKMTRIGRKAIIEKSLMRQSQIELLYMLGSFKEQCDCHRSNHKQCFCGISHEVITTVLPTSTISGEIKKPSSESTYGWVTVTENKIKFSFNVNKIMFCSGNVTERMRMGQLPKSAFRSNEIIFDLYCGVGYYTLPLLFYHGENIHCLYACEWNLQSVLALKHNLIQNEILSPQIVGDSNGKKQRRDKKKNITKADDKNSTVEEPSDKKEFNWDDLIYDFSVNSNPSSTSLESLHQPILSRQSSGSRSVPLAEKVKILYGNNAISTQSFANVADRVLLGLLPSSENGWEIAIRLISSEKGGILHLHENVLESDLQSFIHEKLLVKLSNYCVQYQKAMTVELLHVEKVKSYSPHVYHYVFDILLSPLQNNKK
jgi:tRNA wybutosine-synthesizing protein 3